ncbi:hypothetical protein [Streptomyces fragilis]|uniref:Lipoprotein n=1 Tax=Streptomyces fragilis TaxID=67301 RepID=A0ABV2YLA0_9ACTN|nr:hypothetical protein [Streptomyces fragilis]
MIRTRQLALALIAPFLVTGCVAVTPDAPRPPRDAATATVSRPAAERSAPPQDRGELVESGERKRRATEDRTKDQEKEQEKGREKAGGRSRAGEGTRVRTQGRGEPAAGRPAPRAEIRSGAPGARRPALGRPRAKAERPRAQLRPVPPRPRRHGGHGSGGRGGFRMGEWCRQARGVASSDVVSLCHRAYGH